MYNNITKFINPKYATLFLIVLGGILLALFMNSRYKEGYTNTQINSKLGEKLNNKDLDAKIKQTAAIKTIDSHIRNIKTNKLDSRSSVITNLKSDVTGLKTNVTGLKTDVTVFKTDVNSKLDDNSTTIKDLQGKLSYTTDDIVNLRTYASDLNKNKMDNSSSVISDLQAGIKAKLDASVFDSTMKNVPTGNTISEMVDGKINAKAGDINAAKDLFEKNASDKTTAFDANASAKMTTYDKNAVAQTSTFNVNADSQRSAFNGLFDNKYGTFDSYAKVATNTLGSMKDASVSAAERAEAALNQSIQIQNNIFGASSEKMITQANQYNTNYTNSSVIGQNPGMIYDLSFNAAPKLKYDPSFNGVKEGLDNLQVDVSKLLGLETDVKDKIALYKTAAYNYNNNPNGDTLIGTIRVNNLTALNTSFTNLNTSITTLSDYYLSLSLETDDTASIKAKASAIDNLRRELDTKMQQVLNKQDITNQYDSTVYTGIMWSVLGTSLLYYIFTEM